MNRNIGQQITARMLGYATAIAAGTGDATESNSASYDRQSDKGYLSAKVVVAVQGTLGSGKTVSVAANVQDSANDSDWTDFGAALAATTVATGPSGGGAARGRGELDVNLSGARRYVRVQSTPDLSATGTDTAVVSVVLVLGGAADLPAS